MKIFFPSEITSNTTSQISAMTWNAASHIYIVVHDVRKQEWEGHEGPTCGTGKALRSRYGSFPSFLHTHKMPTLQSIEEECQRSKKTTHSKQSMFTDKGQRSRWDPARRITASNSSLCTGRDQARTKRSSRIHRSFRVNHERQEAKRHRACTDATSNYRLK